MAKKYWIKEAFKKVKAKGTLGKCSGKNFGSKVCPSGSKAYNMAKNLRRIAKGKKKKSSSSAREKAMGIY